MEKPVHPDKAPHDKGYKEAKKKFGGTYNYNPKN